MAPRFQAVEIHSRGGQQTALLVPTVPDKGHTGGTTDKRHSAPGEVEDRKSRRDPRHEWRDDPEDLSAGIGTICAKALVQGLRAEYLVRSKYGADVDHGDERVGTAARGCYPELD